ncbi:hypothetical protein MK280_07400 [Myxococcota bacterium]|nr:hypothetical protein [Myxococcota bacterium]
MFVIILAAAVALYLFARFMPFAPEEQRAGTRLSGSLAQDQDPDWNFLTGQTKIWVETQTWYGIPHSVTTISWVDAGTFYVPCRACDTKKWSAHVKANPNVRIKVGDVLYRRKAVRIEDDDERRLALGLERGQPLPDVAVFRMELRDE